MVYIIPKFLVLHFGEHFMKILAKIPNLSYRCLKICIKMWMKTCFHSHFYAKFFLSLYGGQFKQQIDYSFNLLISNMVFNPLKWWSSPFRLHHISQFRWSKCWFFSPQFNSRWLRLQKVRKIPEYSGSDEILICEFIPSINTFCHFDLFHSTTIFFKN